MFSSSLVRTWRNLFMLTIYFLVAFLRMTHLSLLQQICSMHIISCSQVVYFVTRHQVQFLIVSCHRELQSVEYCWVNCHRIAALWCCYRSQNYSSYHHQHCELEIDSSVKFSSSSQTCQQLDQPLSQLYCLLIEINQYCSILLVV